VNTLAPVALTGAHVRLEPLTLAHVPALCEVGLDPELWRLTVEQVHSEGDMRGYVERALAAQAAGTALPFAVVHLAAARVVGTTRLANVVPEHDRLEIGWTWYGRPWQRTAVNTECKYLLLRHAFEALDCVRVEFKTDVLNQRSRAALRRIGAIEEGVLRSHMRTRAGRRRDSVYFGILRDEWPITKQRLEGLLTTAHDRL
jgi:RimJ/RimL family protein N-acetyltransferase